MSYIYKMVQIPPTIRVKNAQSGTEAAAYLESVVNDMARQGWEFYRVDEVGVREEPGCLAMLLGAKSSYTVYYVVTFRKTV